MTPQEFQLLQRHPEVRNLYGKVVTDRRGLPGKRELRQMIEDAFGDDISDRRKAKIFKQLTELAGKAQDRSQRFGLRQQADEMAVAEIKRIQDGDKLLGAEDEDQTDYAEVRKGVDELAAIHGDFRVA